MPATRSEAFRRVRARRGSQIAIVAVARKLAVLFWHLLTREQDYAFQRPSLTRKKLRASNCAPAPSGSPGDETSRARTPLVADWKATAPTRSPATT
jgi:hypothetical protein